MELFAQSQTTGAILGVVLDATGIFFISLLAYKIVSRLFVPRLTTKAYKIGLFIASTLSLGTGAFMRDGGADVIGALWVYRILCVLFLFLLLWFIHASRARKRQKAIE